MSVPSTTSVGGEDGGSLDEPARLRAASQGDMVSRQTNTVATPSSSMPLPALTSLPQNLQIQTGLPATLQLDGSGSSTPVQGSAAASSAKHPLAAVNGSNVPTAHPGTPNHAVSPTSSIAFTPHQLCSACLEYNTGYIVCMEAVFSVVVISGHYNVSNQSSKSLTIFSTTTFNYVFCKKCCTCSYTRCCSFCCCLQLLPSDFIISLFSRIFHSSVTCSPASFLTPLVAGLFNISDQR